MDKFKWLRLMIMLAPDGGDGGGGSDHDTGGDNGGGDSDPGELFDPSSKLDTRTQAKYWSQLNPKYHKDDFKGVETVDKLYEGYRRLEAESKDALHIPTEKSTPEEIKGFFTKIGMPDDKEKYECDNFDLEESVAAPLKALFKEAAFKNGLTKGQARHLWAHECAAIQGFVNVANQKAEEAKKSYTERYSALLEKEIPDETRRKERMTEEDNLVKAFSAATGLGEYFEKTGLTYNPAFMHGLATWYRRIDPSAIFGSGRAPEGKDEGLKTIYTSM